jgi:enoyl-CoA hydratase
LSDGKTYASGKMLASVRDGVGLITFNQPEKRNAMSVEMWDGLTSILDEWDPDPDVRVVVLTGAGDKAFVSGADISQFEKSRSNADAQREYEKLTSAGRARLTGYAKPVIARIQGFCLGGGLGLAMGADIRIAAESSSFASSRSSARRTPARSCSLANASGRGRPSGSAW